MNNGNRKIEVGPIPKKSLPLGTRIMTRGTRSIYEVVEGRLGENCMVCEFPMCIGLQPCNAFNCSGPSRKDGKYVHFKEVREHSK